jgi:hypothetical protein
MPHLTEATESILAVAALTVVLLTLGMLMLMAMVAGVYLADRQAERQLSRVRPAVGRAQVPERLTLVPVPDHTSEGT